MFQVKDPNCEVVLSREFKATTLGFYNTIVDIGLLLASIIAGVLFAMAPNAPFIIGGLMSISAVIRIGLFVEEAK